MSGILRLESLTKGNTLKQGDKTPLKYRLFDADGEKLNIAGKSAKVRLVYPDFLTIGYEKDGLTVAQDDTVTFTIDNVIPSRIYHVEIIVDDKFIFPSRADESKFTVDKSSLGTETNIIEIVGVDAVVRKAVDLINDDPSLIIDEDKLVSDIIGNTGIGSIEEYHQQFTDVIKELSEEKDYHSLPEIAGARGGHDTLGARLDETTAQLAHKASKQEVFLKRDKSIPIGLNDADDALLSAIQGGTSVEVLSIPRDTSVTPTKTTFFSFGKNLFNPSDPDFLLSKGFSGTTNTVIDAALYNITGYMQANANERIILSSNGVAVINPNYYKVLAYTADDTFISSQTYINGGVILPANTKKIRMQVSATVQLLQIEKGSTITGYEQYRAPFIQEENIPDIDKVKLKNLVIDPSETTFFEQSNNLFNPNNPDILVGKGFSGTTGTLVDAPIYNVTGHMEFGVGDEVLISNNGVEVTNPNLFKVVFYDANGVWISTQTYATSGVVAPANTKTARVQYDNTINDLQIEKNVVTNYEPFGYFISQNFIKGVSQSELKGLNFTSFGDSITFRNAWQPYVVNHFNLTHTNLGIGSTTLAYVASVEEEFPSFTNEPRLNALKASNPDVVTILGGANDAHRSVPIGTDAEFTKVLLEKDKTTYKGAYSFIIETLLTWKPTLEIILITPTQANWAYNYEPYAQATKETAKYYSLPFVNAYSESGISKFTANTYTTDGLHPNDLGGKRLANIVIDKFNAISYV